MKKLLTLMLSGLIILSPMTVAAQNIKIFKDPPFEFYKVTKGDSFWFIAKRYGLDYQELMRINPKVNPYNMQVGSNIRLKAPGNQAQIDKSFESQVVELVNKERTQRGLKPLTTREDLSKVAEVKSRDMVGSNYFSHQSPTYGSPFDMLKRFGVTYRTAGENIAKGQRTPGEVMNAWMNSPGHRKNILNPQFDSIGVGEYNLVWTQIFTGGR